MKFNSFREKIRNPDPLFVRKLVIIGLSIFAFNFVGNKIFIMMSNGDSIDYESAFVRGLMYVESWAIFLASFSVAIPAFLAGINLKRKQGIMSGWWFANFVPIYLVSGFPLSAIFMFSNYEGSSDYDLLLMLLMPIINSAIFILIVGLGFFMMYRPVKNVESGQYEKKELPKEVNLVKTLSIVNFIGLSILTAISFTSIQSISVLSTVLFVIQILFWVSTLFAHFSGAYLMGMGKGMSWWWIANFVLTVILFINIPFVALPLLMPDVWVYLAIVFAFIVPPVAVIALAGLTFIAFAMGKKKRKVEMIPIGNSEVIPVVDPLDEPASNPINEAELPPNDLTRE